MDQSIFLSFIFVLSSCFSCVKHDEMEACLSADKDAAQVGDTLVFTNCSFYDGASPEHSTWFFGDGKNVYHHPDKTINHIYEKAGLYKVRISIGGAEQGDSEEMTITIVE